jgi:hypothetical protein
LADCVDRAVKVTTKSGTPFVEVGLHNHVYG